jgi:hypothetical protein
MKTLATIGVLAMAVAACGSSQEPLAQPGTITSTSAAESTTTTTTEGLALQPVPTSEADLLLLARAARADLAATLGVPEDEISVTGAAAVTWNDGSMGCPQPDMSYTQALVDGARVTLTHDEVTYTYHQGGGQLFLCERPAEGSYTVSTGDSGALELIPPPGFND